MVKRLAYSLKALIFGTRGAQGESLVEVLTAIVIGGLALLMMGMAISVASHTAIDSRDAMDRYYTANNAAIASASGGTVPTGTVSLAETGGASVALVRNGESLKVKYLETDQEGASSIVMYDSMTTGGGA